MEIRKWKLGPLVKTASPVDKYIVNNKNINDSCLKFVTNITETSVICFKQTKEDVTPRYSKPWRTPRCAEIVALKRAAKRQHSRHPTMSNLVAYKRSRLLLPGYLSMVFFCRNYKDKSFHCSSYYVRNS